MIISLPVRILAGNYNGMHFQGSHFMTRISQFRLPGESRHHTFIGSVLVFKSGVVPLYTAGETSFNP